MARPFSPQRHYDLLGRVERKFVRLAKAAQEVGHDDKAKSYLKMSAATKSVGNYIRASQFGQAVAYMKKQGEAFIVELPETFETLGNQQALKSSKK